VPETTERNTFNAPTLLENKNHARSTAPEVSVGSKTFQTLRTHARQQNETRATRSSTSRAKVTYTIDRTLGACRFQTKFQTLLTHATHAEQNSALVTWKRASTKRRRVTAQEVLAGFNSLETVKSLRKWASVAHAAGSTLQQTTRLTAQDSRGVSPDSNDDMSTSLKIQNDAPLVF
jgi:hypothetical protein